MAGRMILDNVKFLDAATPPTEAGVLQRNGSTLQVFMSAAQNLLLQSGSASTAPTTPDALADFIWGTSATTQKALVLQAKASQTANVFEVQASTGAVNFAVNATGDAKLHGIAYTWPSADGTNGYVLTTNGSGVLSWTDSASSKWNAIPNPDGNQALTMLAYTSTWTWNDATAGGNLFSLTDTLNNSGTGYMLNVKIASGSSVKPLYVGTNTIDSIVVLASGRVGIKTASPGNFGLDVGGTLNVQGNTTIAGGNLTVTGAAEVAFTQVQANGAALNTLTITEEVTIADAANTDSTSNLLPANSLIIAVSYRVTVVSTGPTAFDIGVSGDTTRYGTAVPNNTGTGVGSSFSLAIPLNPSMQKTAAKIRVTPDSTPSAADGKIRIVTMYQTVTAPTA